MSSFLRFDFGWDGTPRLVGRKVVLRPPRSGDYAQWAQLRAESRAFLQPWEPAWSADELSRDSWRRRLKRYAEDTHAGITCPFLMFRAGDETLVGGINLNGIQRGVAQMCSVGYWVGERHARQGFAREALQLAVGHAFDTLDLHRVEANCLPSNLPSRRLIETSGFQFEGMSRAYLMINGRWEDHLRFAVVRDDALPWRPHAKT
jgi:[ribosomal protein S5]-alanine N-acetyltransferase